jgi:hypothetical protein
MDTLFHSRIAKVEAMVGDIKSEVQLAVQDVLEEVAKVSDIQVGAGEGGVEMRVIYMQARAGGMGAEQCCRAFPGQLMCVVCDVLSCQHGSLQATQH